MICTGRRKSLSRRASIFLQAQIYPSAKTITSNKKNPRVPPPHPHSPTSPSPSGRFFSVLCRGRCQPALLLRPDQGGGSWEGSATSTDAVGFVHCCRQVHGPPGAQRHRQAVPRRCCRRAPSCHAIPPRATTNRSFAITAGAAVARSRRIVRRSQRWHAAQGRSGRGRGATPRSRREGGRGAAVATVLPLPRSNLRGRRGVTSAATALPSCPFGQIWEVGEGSHYCRHRCHRHRSPTIVLWPNPRQGEGRRSEGEVEVREEEEGRGSRGGRG